MLERPIFRILSGNTQHLYWVNTDEQYHWRLNNGAFLGQWIPGLPRPKQTNPAPVITGYEHRPPSNDFHLMSSCRVMLGKSMELGKVVSNRCNVAWNRQELTLPNYQVLYYAPNLAPTRPFSSQTIQSRALLSSTLGSTIQHLIGAS